MWIIWKDIEIFLRSQGCLTISNIILSKNWKKMCFWQLLWLSLFELTLIVNKMQSKSLFKNSYQFTICLKKQSKFSKKSMMSKKLIQSPWTFQSQGNLISQLKRIAFILLLIKQVPNLLIRKSSKRPNSKYLTLIRKEVSIRSTSCLWVISLVIIFGFWKQHIWIEVEEFMSFKRLSS